MDQAALPLQTERLTLRPLTEADAPAIAAIGGHPDVARMIAASTSPWPLHDAADYSILHLIEFTLSSRKR